jgi:hypothetical protein
LQVYSKQPLIEDTALVLKIGNSDGPSLKLRIVYTQCHSLPAICETAVNSFVQDAARTALRDPPLLTPENLRAGLFLNSLPEQILDFPDPMGDDRALRKQVAGMLDERCYLDPQRPYPELRFSMLNRLNISFGEAFDLCEKNLRAALGPMSEAYNQLPPDRIGMVRGTRYEAARMLLYDQWTALQQKLGGKLIVAAPEEGMIVFSNSDDPVTVAAVMARAKQIAMSSSDILEYDVYRFNGNGWDQLTIDESHKVRMPLLSIP